MVGRGWGWLWEEDGGGGGEDGGGGGKRMGVEGL